MFVINIDHDKCNECWHCTDVCDNLGMYIDEARYGDGEEYPFIMWDFEYCMHCKECIKECENGALSYEEI